MTSISLATLARRAADLGNPLPCSDDTQLWFSEHPADLELAKAMCETCPLRRPCLAGAVDRAAGPGPADTGLSETDRPYILHGCRAHAAPATWLRQPCRKTPARVVPLTL